MLVLLRFYGVCDGRLCGNCASISDVYSTDVRGRIRIEKKVEGIEKLQLQQLTIYRCCAANKNKHSNN